MIARTTRNQGACLTEQLIVHAKKRLAEADPARVVVVHEHAGLVEFRKRPRGKCAGPCRRVRRATLARAYGDPDVLAVAHQQELRHVPHRERQPDYAVTPFARAERQCRHHLARQRQPVRCGVHLLLGQVQFPRPDVLVGVELDLLESNHARDNVHLPV